MSAVIGPKPSRIPSFAFLASQMTTVNDVRFGTFWGPFLPWIIPNGSTDSFVHWIMAVRPSNHYMSLSQSALGTQQDGRQRKFKLAVKAEKELTRLEEQFLVPNILSFIHLPFWEIFAWRVEVPFKHLKEEMQVNLMMTISMTPRELHLMYNFMTLYITVINLLV